MTNDDWAGGVAVVEHCASLGHRRIAHIDGGQGAGAAARRSGYQDAMKQLRPRPGSRAWCRAPFTEEGGHSGALLLLDERPRPTAIFAANDLAAIGA